MEQWQNAIIQFLEWDGLVNQKTDIKNNYSS